MKTKYLIFSDVHTNIDRADEIIKAESPDVTVCLGDIFDEFGDRPEDNGMAAYWLQENLKKDNFTCLWGNHDIHYAYPQKLTVCSGFEQSKLMAINSAIDRIYWKKMRWYCWLDKHLLTHAGLSKHHVDLLKEDNESLEQFLYKESLNANKALIEQSSHWFFRAGYTRGGSQPIGGVIWCDWREFTPIPNLTQVFGHTPSDRIRVKHVDSMNRDDYPNYCIDTHLMQYLVYQNGKFEQKKLLDL